jgi:integrase
MPQTRNRRSGVEDRWTKTVRKPDGTTELVPSARHGKGLRWHARWVDDDGTERSKAFRTKTEAKASLEEIVSSQLTGSYVDPVLGKVTFASFYKDWSTRQVWESSTRHAMELAAKSVTFGSVPLADLRKSHVELWVKDMQRNKLQPTTIRTRFANVHAAIRVASSGRPRLMAEDVCIGVKLPPARKASAAMAIPTTAEVGKVIRAAEEPFAAFIAVCAFAGLRRGEASALRVSDVNFLRKELHVQQQVQWTDDGQMEIRPPKYGSERTVYIPDGLVTILSEYVRLHRPGDDADRYLFPGSRDDTVPAHAATVARSWRIARAKAKISYRLHDCRHFFASGLINAGCDVVTVQKALGHSSPSVTLDTYSHLWPNANDRTRNAASALLEESLEPAADSLRTEHTKTPAD